MSLLVTNIGRLYTASERGVLTDAAVLIEGESIAWIGSTRGRPPADLDGDVDAEGGLVTPGLVDAHSHPVYAGNRLAEITLRSTGASYQQVAASGGGIRSTVTATRATPVADLCGLVERRLGSWLSGGTTTVEAKTGYHLERDGELAAVRLLASLSARPRRTTDPAAHTFPHPTDPAPAAGAGAPRPPAVLPRVEVTFLGAHDVDPDLAVDDDGDRDAAFARHAAAVAGWCPDALQAGARFVDVFCDAGYFSVEQSRRVLTAGQAAGLVARVHADELQRTGGAQLAAEIGAVSADHLLCATPQDAAALAAAGVVATLCPVTALAMRRSAPARMLRDHGVRLALGSDHNPGQSGTTSMSLVVGLAVHTLGLSVDEALVAATAGGAAALRRPDRGALRPGMAADLVVWDAEHEGAFAWDLGLAPRHVVLAGRPVPLPRVPTVPTPPAPGGPGWA